MTATLSILDCEAEARREAARQQRQNERRFWLSMLRQKDRLEAEIKAIDSEIARHARQLEIITRDAQQKIADLHTHILRVRQQLADAKAARHHLLCLADAELIEQRDRLIAAINEAEANASQLRQSVADAQFAVAQAPETFATYGDKERRIELAQSRAISAERELLAAEQRLADLRGELAAVEQAIFADEPAVE